VLQISTPVRLTSRQREVLALIGCGFTNKEIAEQLAVCLKTVEFHRKRLTERLDTHCVAQLTLVAIREGLVDTYQSRTNGETRV
jgi:two-component system response regulator FixJ